MFLLENRGNCLHVSEFFVLIFLILPFSCSSMILGFQILNVSIPNMISIWHLVFHFFCHSTILLFNPCFDFCFIILVCFLLFGFFLCLFVFFFFAFLLFPTFELSIQPLTKTVIVFTSYFRCLTCFLNLPWFRC